MVLILNGHKKSFSRNNNIEICTRDILSQRRLTPVAQHRFGVNKHVRIIVGRFYKHSESKFVLDDTLKTNKSDKSRATYSSRSSGPRQNNRL